MFKDKIELDGNEYTLREVRLGKYNVDVMVSSDSLRAIMKDENDKYTSRDAQLLDEIIFKYVPDTLIDGSDEDLEKYISDSLDW